MVRGERLKDKLAELEKITGKLQSDIEIEEAVELYEKGIKLASSIRTYLKEAEKKVAILSESGVREVDEEHVGKK